MGFTRKTYGQTPCKICGKSITTNGLGYVSHYRKHVREGKAIERVQPYGYDLGDARIEFDALPESKESNE